MVRGQRKSCARSQITRRRARHHWVSHATKPALPALLRANTRRFNVPPARKTLPFRRPPLPFPSNDMPGERLWTARSSAMACARTAQLVGDRIDTPREGCRRRRRTAETLH